MPSTRIARKHLLKTIGPPFIAVRNQPRELMAEFEYRGRNRVVRKLRGGKCLRYQPFMDELGAAMQFFYEFGENWSAVHELLCFMDEWLEGEGYVIVVEHAEELFKLEPVEFPTFVRIMEAVGQWWAQPVVGNGRFDRPARPFHVVLESSDPSVGEHLHALGVNFAIMAGLNSPPVEK